MMKKIIKPMCVVLAGLISITWVNLAYSEEPEPFILRIPDSEIRKSLNNIHHEICECLAFFIAGTAKAKEQGATESDLAAVNNAAIELAELARLLHQDKVTTARIGLASDQMMNAMDYDYANFSLLLQKYQPACVRLHSDAYEKVFRLLVAAQEEGLL